MLKLLIASSARLLIVLCITITAFGQARLEPAFIVLNNGDTLRGWINYKGWEHGPQSIGFSQDSGTHALTTYRVSNLRYFELAGAEAYERAVIQKDNLTNDTVFLRLLVKGRKLSIYEGNSDRFFLREAGGSFEELTRYTLKIYAQKYELSSLFPEIDAAGSNEHDLVRIVLLLNSSSGATTYTRAVLPNKLHWYLGAGGGISGLTISGDKSYLGQISFSNTVVVPYMTLGFDYLFSKGIGPWGLRFEAAYFSATYEASGVSTGTELDHINYTLSQRDFSTSGYVLYNFMNNRCFKLYGAGGVSANFASYPQNTYVNSWPTATTMDNYATMSSFWLSFNPKIGVILHNKIEAGVAAIIGDYSKELAYSFEPHTYFVWVAWRL